jgi:ferrous iron transport protein B
MGLTGSSTGIRAVDSGLEIQKQAPDDRVVALAGNPNVGKSTLFNTLTNLNQHTGNWPGKTVASAQGRFQIGKHACVLVDLPGTYSLMAHSTEEEVARNFICFGQPDTVVVVCDATCLERNLNLVLQTLEITSQVIVCVNLMDEAKRKHIRLDLPLISLRLGVPVVGAVARKKRSLDSLTRILDGNPTASAAPRIVRYPEIVERAIAVLEPRIRAAAGEKLNSRWLSLKLLDQDDSLLREINACMGPAFLRDSELRQAIADARALLEQQGVGPDQLRDLTVSALVTEAENVCRGAVTYEHAAYSGADRRIDRILTSRLTGYPIMLALLALIFWITISGANGPSQLIAKGLFRVQDLLLAFFIRAGAPTWLREMLVLGVYRVLAWVISVMLPPMAIFFPLFTLLEDAGYLPRVAYNLDKPFKCCHACGKQALTM